VGRGCRPPPSFPVTSSRSTNCARGICPRRYSSRPLRPARYQRKSITRTSLSSMRLRSQAASTSGPNANYIPTTRVSWQNCTARARQLGPLDIERRVLEHRVLAAVVEVEVAVDHDLHVGRAEVMLGEGLGRMAVHDPPLFEELSRPADTGVHEDRPCARVLDD